MNGPIPRPNTQESFYMPAPSYMPQMFEAGQGHQNGMFQEQLYRQNNFEEIRPRETIMGRNRRMK